MSTAIHTVSSTTSMARAYERLRALIVWLGIGEVAWISSWLYESGAGSFALQAATVAWITAMIIWLAFAIRLAGHGFFMNGSRWLSNLVGFAAVVAMTVAIFGAVPAIRNGLFAAASGTSDTQLIAIHLLRVLAIGTALKFWQRQLPRHFFLLGTVPDFLFALSAVPMLVLAGNGSLNPTTLTMWHAIGATVFLGAGVSMFFSVPSPFRLFHTKPDTALAFEFPMLLAPNFTVPLFVVAHLFAITKYVIGS